jgi:hypothetical protein
VQNGVGDEVGAKLGQCVIPAGKFVGASVGAAVGLNDGTSVDGASVGATVGASVGTVGASVVGTPVGAVGACVQIAHVARHNSYASRPPSRRREVGACWQ